MRKFNNHKGFSLIEISIVFAIIGILLSASLKLIGPLSLLLKVRETKESEDSTIQSIISWVASRNRLPNKNEFIQIAKTPRDPWGLPFVYMYYSSLYKPNPTKDTICGRRSTPLKLYNNYTSSSVAFAIISRGDKPAYDSTLNDSEITDSTLSNVAGIIKASGPTPDIVRWVTLDELRSKIGCQSPQLKILTNELPIGSDNSTYITTSVYADGGVQFSGGKYRWCIQNSLKDSSVPHDLTFKNLAGNELIPFADCQNLGKNSWVLSENLVIGGKPIISVIGTDTSTKYSCIKSHIASDTIPAESNRPTTNSSSKWDPYWLAATGTTTSVWTSDPGYYYLTKSNIITVYVSDNDENVSYKTFQLTIN